MGNNALKCVKCEAEKVDYTINLIRVNTTELYAKPYNILGFTYIPKPNTRTLNYLCSNGHFFIKTEKSK